MHENTGTTPQRRERIDTLDILRGFAILGILFMNIPAMGNTGSHFKDPRLLGWTFADRTVWSTLEIFLEGTQRGLLELLFGATALILVGGAIKPTDPIGPADIYYRRTIWLILFGLIHGTLLLWPGEVLFNYGIAGLFLFPLRRLKARTLATIGALGLLLLGAISAPSYLDDVRLQKSAAAAAEQRAQGMPITAAQRTALKEWDEAHRTGTSPKIMKAEREARRGGYGANLPYLFRIWKHENASLTLYDYLAESILTMMIGMALFKWGVLQGERSRSFYLRLMIAGYGIGLPLNLLETQSRIAQGFLPPDWTDITYQIGRMAMTFGHVGLFIFLSMTTIGAVTLKPLKATGRMALSTYVTQSIVTMFMLFPGFGFGLWGRFGWTELASIALAIVAAQIVVANLWMQRFEMGPLEWLWRWLTYGQKPAMRRRALVSAPA